MGRQPSDLNEERTMLKAGLFLAFVVLAAVQVSGDQKPSNAAMQRYMAYGRPNSMIFLHPTRSMEKRGRQIFWPRPVMEMADEVEELESGDESGLASLYDSIE